MVTYQDAIRELKAAEMKVDLVREMYADNIFSDYSKGIFDVELTSMDTQIFGNEIEELRISVKNTISVLITDLEFLAALQETCVLQGVKLK